MPPTHTPPHSHPTHTPRLIRIRATSHPPLAWASAPCRILLPFRHWPRRLPPLHRPLSPPPRHPIAAWAPLGGSQTPSGRWPRRSWLWLRKPSGGWCWSPARMRRCPSTWAPPAGPARPVSMAQMGKCACSALLVGTASRTPTLAGHARRGGMVSRCR